MSVTITIPTPRRPRRREPASGWAETEAAALAVAGVTGIHLQPSTVRAVVTESMARHGGPDGVAAELERQRTHWPEQSARTLAWAHRVLDQVAPQSSQPPR